MVLGFNHNIRYKSELFHVQTEDSGRANPHIITLLYRGGTIIASAKTSYADIIKAEQLELVVESIMKEQHKEMMRRLKGGEFDAKIFPTAAQASPSQAAASAAPPASPVKPAPPQGASTPPGACAVPGGAPAPGGPAPESGTHRQVTAPVPPPPTIPPLRAPAAQGASQPAPASPAAKAAPVAPAAPAPPAKRSLDEVILDYLITGEE